MIHKNNVKLFKCNLFIYRIILNTVNANNIYNITNLLNTSGLYLKNNGKLKITTTRWNLITYANLTSYNESSVIHYYTSITQKNT